MPMEKFKTAAVVFAFALQIATVHSAAAGSGYVEPSQLDLIHILAPPPRLNSSVGRADLQAVIEAQRDRTPAEEAAARADAQLTIFRLADVMGPGFTPANLPFTQRFFGRLRMDEGPILEEAKEHFDRPRPAAVDRDVHPAIIEPAGPSYPSGHALFVYMVGILLARMVPEKSAAIFDRAASYAHNRVIAGVHYPTDVEAGKIAGSVLDNVLLTEPIDSPFHRDFTRARAEVRRAIGLR